MTLSCQGKYACFQTYILEILRPWKCLEFESRLSLRGVRPPPLTSIWAAVLYIEFSHRGSFAKNVFLSLKKEGGGVKERKPFFLKKDLMMFAMPSESRILQLRKRTCQNHIIKEDPFFPSSYHFSYKTRHLGSEISVVNNVSTFPRWVPSTYTHRHPAYL